jgi:phospholipid/cholesterol/gamma-HCH transport system substrate-binding protein
MPAKSDGYSNRELTREMIVGTFIGSVFLVLVVFTIVVSGNRLFSGVKRSTVAVHFSNVGGLRRHDAVLVRGVPIGKVRQLQLNNDGVDVTLTLDDAVEFRDGYRIKVMQSSLLGGMQLIIDEGTGEPLADGTPLVGEQPDNVMEDLGTLVRDVRQSLNEGGVLGNLQRAVEDIAELTGRLRRGEGTLGRLLSADNTLIGDLEATMANIRRVTERVEKGEGTLGRLLSADDTVYADLQGTLANLRSITGRLEAGEGTLGRLLATDDTLYRDLSETVANLRSITGRLEAGEGTLGRLLAADDAVYRDLADTIANLKTVTGRLEQGEGLLGQLLKPDSPMAAQLDGLLKDGRDMIDDAREASPISTFSSIFFGVF